MLASYPVNHHPARAAVLDALRALGCGGARCGDAAGPGVSAAATLLFFGSTLATSLLVSDLGTIFQLVGGTCGGLLIFTLPGLMLMQVGVSHACTACVHVCM